MKPILFLLPVKGGSGGAHSVMQEADAMWSMGQPVIIACNAGNTALLAANYADLPRVSANIRGFHNAEELKAIITAIEPKVVVATTNQSVHTLAEAVRDLPNVRTAYYVQDYETFFYEAGSDDWRLAFASYGLIPGMLHFAKTRWLQEVVEQNHGVSVTKVAPSVDHTVYYPDFSRISDESTASRAITIVAMLRPVTPRRAPQRTVRILNQLAQTYGERVNIKIFGCQTADIAANNLHIDPQIENLGVLSRTEVGNLFRETDMFLDLSDFQAFGRTAIEAMSCGVISVVPAHGGAYEFGVDGQNCFVVDMRFDDRILACVEAALAMLPGERFEMRKRAIKTGFQFSVEKAALSELDVLV